MTDRIREITIAIYQEGSPEILSTCQCGENQADMQCGEGESWVEVDESVSDDTHYIDIDQRVAVARSAFDPQCSVGDLVVHFIGLPADTVIGAMGQELIADGDDEVEFDVPGTYRIALSHPRYLDETVEVTVG
ncbi:hypothetical protein RSO41_05840 [Halomonas sp. I1]|uniref:hypothetical protein n=1 Tax=Halomonas sp. I1 TaxID=393536 RepID=UPI0028E01806|nr:hypothetical protein [Halomonas sp. I1]MDT8894170.1 hypothetical protein [Halomonas sp. I1]